jgi:hypothetical protein
VVPVAPAESDSRRDDAAPLLPADDSGYQLRPRDADFLGISPESVTWWSRREAPLGMTPDKYKHFTESLYAALEADGISPDDVDVRLQGSAAHFFSGAHKRLATEDDPEVQENETAQQGLRAWFDGDVERPLRRPYDAHRKLGLTRKKSDYDVQISSDVMVRKCQETWDRGVFKGRFISPRYGFVNKACFRDAFPALTRWAGAQSGKQARKVAPALFTSAGPRDNSPGVSSHFRSTDWMLEGNE